MLNNHISSWASLFFFFFFAGLPSDQKNKSNEQRKKEKKKRRGNIYPIYTPLDARCLWVLIRASDDGDDDDALSNSARLCSLSLSIFFILSVFALADAADGWFHLNPVAALAADTLLE